MQPRPDWLAAGRGPLHNPPPGYSFQLMHDGKRSHCVARLLSNYSATVIWNLEGHSNSLSSDRVKHFAEAQEKKHKNRIIYELIARGKDLGDGRYKSIILPSKYDKRIRRQRCIQSASLRPGRTDRDSGRTEFERVRQFGRTDGGFGYTKSKHWHPISGFRKLISNLANEIQASASK